MFHTRWLDKLFGLAHSWKQRPRPAQSRKLVRLMLESLEDRLTPAGGNPTATAGANAGPPPTALLASTTISIDVAALLLQDNPFGLFQVSNFSQSLLGRPLTPLSQLENEIFANLPYAGDLAFSAVQTGISFAAMAASSSDGGIGGTKALVF
jgi:hypothetical protein